MLHLGCLQKAIDAPKSTPEHRAGPRVDPMSIGKPPSDRPFTMCKTTMTELSVASDFSPFPVESKGWREASECTGFTDLPLQSPPNT
jgi:hypothetical protein